ncbi:RNA polymerase sigma factor [Bacteroidota bacterium]
MTEIKDDYELVNEFLSGDEAAFNRLVHQYQEKIYWHARRMTGNHFDADEIVQEVLMVMYKKLNTFKFESSLYTWIYKITSTRSLNLIRKNRLKSFFSESDEADHSGINANDIIGSIESKEKLEKVQRLLQKIPIRQREVFVFRNFDELSYKEISEITGKSEGALKANYFHAFNKIKELMGND